MESMRTLTRKGPKPFTGLGSFPDYRLIKEPMYRISSDCATWSLFFRISAISYRFSCTNKTLIYRWGKILKWIVK
jgi:hypothetical protein